MKAMQRFSCFWSEPANDNFTWPNLIFPDAIKYPRCSQRWKWFLKSSLHFLLVDVHHSCWCFLLISSWFLALSRGGNVWFTLLFVELLRSWFTWVRKLKNWNAREVRNFYSMHLPADCRLKFLVRNVRSASTFWWTFCSWYLIQFHWYGANRDVTIPIPVKFHDSRYPIRYHSKKAKTEQ